MRIRVNWTIRARPDSDGLSVFRGGDKLRVGTCFISYVSEPIIGEPCACEQCDGKEVRKLWRFKVKTAHHVIYNTEEARDARVDLFYDDEQYRIEGAVVTLRALEIDESREERDACLMECVTHDTTLAHGVCDTRYHTGSWSV